MSWKLLKVFFFLSLLSYLSFATFPSPNCVRELEKLNSVDSYYYQQPTPIEKLELTTTKESLITIQKNMSDSDINIHNKAILDSLGLPLSVAPSQKTTEVDHSVANQIVSGLINHPTHGRIAERSYDPKGNYGFCFGRATLIHSIALSQGVEPRAIKKIWAVGSLEKNRWEFHVATMLKAKGLTPWWVTDPIFNQADSVYSWISRMRQFADDNRLTFFVTDPRRFSVYSPKIYSAIDLFGDGKTDFYNHYFLDFFESLNPSAIQK